MSNVRILIIEDEKLIRWSLRSQFEKEGYVVDEAETGQQGLRMIDTRTYDLVMLDYKLPDITGLDVLREIRRTDGDLVVVIMTAYSRIEDAVEAMRLGAYDYVGKPFRMDVLMMTVRKALETTRLKREVRDFREEMQSRFGFDKILGRCPAMVELFNVLRDVSASGASTIFLRGESGTGKDLVAKTIHYNSARANQPFMNITCTAITETLLESELFGHERGAFTDAKDRKKGLFELADGGTVFLDEVGDMPEPLQAKLLRFLEEKTFRRVGGTSDIQVDVRIIAATNRNIDQLVAERKFREDLFYRLNIVPIFLPPLRERGDDVVLIAMHYVEHFAREFRKPVTGISADGLERLREYSWPGNVRELRNVLERAVLLSKQPILTASDFAVDLNVAPPSPKEGFTLPPGGVSLEEVERQLVTQAWEDSGHSLLKAARLLNITRDQLRYRLTRFNLK
ncbi:MAG: sigma-54 dependent transcriptional regulator [Phycisphaerae bacterium]|nr:sigma-54 dependent transcriptional regulator [Phycisphaerae bacterium]